MAGRLEVGLRVRDRGRSNVTPGQVPRHTIVYEPISLRRFRECMRARVLSVSLIVKCVGGSLEGTPMSTIANLLPVPVIQSRFRVHAREAGLGSRNIFIAASSCVGNGGCGWMSGEDRGV